MEKKTSVYLSNKKYELDTIFKKYSGDFATGYTGGLDLIVKDSIYKLVYNFCKFNKVKIVDINSSKVTEIPNLNNECNYIHTDIKNHFIYLINNENLVKIDKLNHSNAVFYPLKNFKEFNKTGLCSGISKFGSDERVNVPENVFYFRTYIDLSRNNGKYSNRVYNYPTFCKVNLDNFQFEFFGKDFDSNYGFNDVLYDLYVGDSIFVSYGSYSKIEIINTLNKKSIIKNIKSKYDTVSRIPMNYKFKKDDLMNQKSKITTLNSFYEPLFYNPLNKKYYRIFHTYLPEYDEEGLLNTEEEKLCILMVIDENLNLEDEFILPIKAVSNFKLFPVKNGIEIILPKLFKDDKKNAVRAFLKITHN